MDALAVDLRNQLERVVVEARAVAESGARVALESLAVSRGAPLEFMTDDDRQLRNRLRAHGRQLGDIRNAETGIQGLEHLANECAYQLWHRLLFGRFLIENRLLIEPTFGVTISIEECEELARERRCSPWDVVVSYTQAMLPDIFPYEIPVFQVKFAPETQQTLEQLLGSLPSKVFTESDSLGWTYQFWQTAEKKRVNDRVNSGDKVSGDMLPAITQLFTEDYMVRFLLHNTIGSWHAGRRLTAMGGDASSLTTEEAVRQVVSPQGYDWNYLRFTRVDGDGNGRWRPAAGTFDEWPRTVKELKVLDPACGSGHFLVAALELLVKLRMEEEQIPLDKAIYASLNDNLFGLEIDPRCAQIAAFNLAFSAWKMVGRPIALPPLHVACTGLTIGLNKKDWLMMAGDNVKLRGTMELLFDLFEKAPELGSLIEPKLVARNDFFTADFSDVKPLLDEILERSKKDSNDERREASITAQGMAEAAEMLMATYHLVITNVPYLHRGKQGKVLREFSEKNFPVAKQDLATVFMERCLKLLLPGGTISLVLPQNWLYLTSYKQLRQRLLRDRLWNFLVLLGPAAFETISGEVVKPVLCGLTASTPSETHKFVGTDVAFVAEIGQKRRELRYGDLLKVNQIGQMANPDARILFQSDSGSKLLADYATSYWGLGSGDYFRFGRTFWERTLPDRDWIFQLSTCQETQLYSGREHILYWQDGNGDLVYNPGAFVRGTKVWGREGIHISQMGDLPVTLYKGEAWDTNSSPIIPHDPSHLSAIWCFCSSPEYSRLVRRIDKKLNVTNATLVKVPFDLEYWKQVAAEQYPNGLPQPYTDDPTQWVFHGHPVPSENPLHVAVVRLLGYRWPAELDTTMELSDAARTWAKKCDSLVTYAVSEGILPLIPLRGERGAAERLRELLEAAYGERWSPDIERQLVRSGVVGSPGPRTLDEWLRDRFFQEHSALFHQRPFIWHIWDGRKDGFHALVNYHRLAGPNGEGWRTLESLTYAYLGEWIERQRVEQKEGQEGADARLVAAMALQEQLERILEGNPPYDLFIRWKPLHQQPIGWDPDINDGVRLNIRPFVMAQLPSGRGKTSILRSKVSVRWSKDRGKESRQHRDERRYPWFWSCDPENNPNHRTDFLGGTTFDGYRWNDLHYSRAAKETARDTEEGRLERG